MTSAPESTASSTAPRAMSAISLARELFDGDEAQWARARTVQGTEAR